jgi:hypothetical protein
MDFHNAMLRLQSAPTRALDWIETHKIDYAIKYILDPMRDLQTSRGHAQSVIDRWQVNNTGYLTMELVNDHKYIDLLEYGWDDYDVYPLGEANGGKEALKFFWKGQWHIRKHTHPRGFRGYHIINSAENFGFFERFLNALIDGANRWLQEARLV